MGSKLDRTQLFLGVAAALCSAVLFYLGTGVATGGAPIAVLAWIAPFPVFLLAPRISTWKAVGIAFLAYFLGTANSWGYYLNSRDIPLPAGALICVGLSLMFVLAVWLFRVLIGRGWVLLATIAAPAAWTAAAYLLQVLNPRGLMGTFAPNQADFAAVLQIASITGAWGVEFLVLFVPAALAALCTPGVMRAARWRTAMVVVGVLALTFGFGAVRLANADGPTQRVALIAHNHAEWGVDVATPAGRALIADYIGQIAALPNDVKTVVLPEGAFSANDTTMTEVAAPMRRVARVHGVDVVLGMTRHANDEKYQVALTFPAGGTAPVSYLKHHDMVSPPGHELTFPPVTGARLGVEICADLDHANPSRNYARAGVELMAIPASDEDVNGWQHSRNGLLRGVEHGFAVAWSARRGQLVIADGWGRVQAETHTGGTEPFSTVVADVTIGPGATYTTLGDWFAWLCLITTAGCLLATILVQRAKGTQQRGTPPVTIGTGR